MSLNTFINALDRIASTWDGYKVMADHVRKVNRTFLPRSMQDISYSVTLKSHLRSIKIRDVCICVCFLEFI